MRRVRGLVPPVVDGVVIATTGVEREAPTVRIEDGVPWIGDRSFPWASRVDVEDLPTGSSMWRTRRFRLTFENGWTLSVVFGSGNYCANYNSDLRGQEFREACPDAEVGAWIGAGGLLPWDDGDTVKGRVSASDLLDLVDSMMTWPSDGLPEGHVLSLSGPMPEVPR